MEMAQIKHISLLDVDVLVDEFVTNNNNVIHKIWSSKNKASALGYDAFILELKPLLRNSCVTFVNSNLDISVLNTYLYPTILTAARKILVEDIKKIAVSICPAHQFLNIDEILTGNKIYKCQKCENIAANPNCSTQQYKLHSMFALHSKRGYKCPDCNRFIPHPLDSSRNIICPYFDCCFVGDLAQLIAMRHPTMMQKVKIDSLDQNIKNSNNLTGKDILISNQITVDSEFELREERNKNINLLKEIMESQSNSLYYTSSNFTRTHYILMYEAFAIILNKFPEEMISYLIYLKRGEALQHKIFQEYVYLLEKNIPFGFKKNNQMYKITSLLDENLCIFDGISHFDGVLNSKKEVKNGTKEFYIGGRSASYSKPYYIGKLLDVVNKNTNTSILDDVKEYSFSKIIFKNSPPQTPVLISHLRIPPHYQMGGMVYLNRIRRKIVDKAYLTLYGKKRKVKNGQ